MGFGRGCTWVLVDSAGFEVVGVSTSGGAQPRRWPKICCQPRWRMEEENLYWIPSWVVDIVTLGTGESIGVQRKVFTMLSTRIWEE